MYIKKKSRRQSVCPTAAMNLSATPLRNYETHRTAQY